MQASSAATKKDGAHRTSGETRAAHQPHKNLTDRRDDSKVVQDEVPTLRERISKLLLRLVTRSESRGSVVGLARAQNRETRHTGRRSGRECTSFNVLSDGC